MYLDFFGLEREPFHITPDPDFLFPSPSHKEAFATVMYGVQQQKGFVVVTGEVGTGKTTVLRAYLQKLKGTDIQPIYIFDPHLGFEELLEAILAELGAPADAGHTQFARLQWLRHYLIDAYSNGRSVVLIIDEAQNMPIETMEKLRVLTNLETTKDKLLQVLLVGQPELEEKLGLHQLRQLNQRVAVRATLRPLGDEESTDYVKHRVRQAGGVPETIFNAASLKAIVRHAKGNPRVLNITCDNVLAAGLGAQQSPITPALVREVLKDLSPRRARQFDLRRLAPMAAAAVVLLLAGIGALSLLRDTPGAEASVPTAAAPSPAVAEVTVAPEVVEAPGAEAPEEEFDARQMAMRRMLGKETTQPPAATPAPQEEVATDEALTDEALVEETSTEEIPAPPIEVAALPVEPVVEAASEAVAAEEIEPKATEPEATEPETVVPEPTKPEPVAEVQPEPTLMAAAPVVVPQPEAKPEPEAAPVAEAPVEVVAAPVVEEVEEEKVAAAPVSDGPVEPAPVAEETTNAAREQQPLERAPLIRDENGRLVRQVKKGDKLILLLEEVYGKSNPTLIETVREANPNMIDPNLILAGDQLVFPGAQVNAETPAEGDTTPPASN